MVAPGILPWSALSIVGVGARVSSAASTVDTAFARFRFSTPVAWPVITISSSLNTSGSSATFTDSCSGGTVTCWRLYPIAAHHEVRRAIGRVEDEPAIIAGLRHDLRPEDRDRGFGQTLLRLRVRDAAGDLAHLGLRCMTPRRRRRSETTPYTRCAMAPPKNCGEGLEGLY